MTKRQFDILLALSIIGVIWVIVFFLWRALNDPYLDRDLPSVLWTVPIAVGMWAIGFVMNKLFRSMEHRTTTRPADAQASLWEWVQDTLEDFGDGNSNGDGNGNGD